MSIPIPTALFIAFAAFEAGFVLMAVIKDEGCIRLSASFDVVAAERDRLKAELSSLNRQYYDLEDVLDVRNVEIGQLRADLLELRAERVVFHSDMPPEAA